MSGRHAVVELFAGVGGFRVGLERGGWNVVWSNQWEPSTNVQHASNCYDARFASGTHSNVDLHDALDQAESGEAELPEHDLLVGGFPCQDYSVARPKNASTGIEGKKGVLWWEIHRLLRLKRPPYLFLENVDRLLKSPASQRGRDFGVMLTTLAELGYEVEWRVINAADYGFPQKRRRVLLVGRQAGTQAGDSNAAIYRGVLARAFPVQAGPTLSSAETFRVPDDPIEVTESFGATRGTTPFRNTGYMSHRRVWTLDLDADWDGPKQTLADILEPAGEIDERYFIPIDELPRWRYLKGAKREQRYHKGTDTPYFYAEGAIPFPDPTDRPARTILTGEAGRSPSRFKHVIEAADGRYRRLTPRELERLNGFPDDWTDTGMPEGRRGFMMGNALVVGLVERVGRELRRDMDAAGSASDLERSA